MSLCSNGQMIPDCVPKQNEGQSLDTSHQTKGAHSTIDQQCMANILCVDNTIIYFIIPTMYASDVACGYVLISNTYT